MILDKVGSDLWDTQKQLWEKINNPETEPDVRSALRMEYMEVNHRLQIIIGRELTSEIAELQIKADKVSKARNELQKVLDNIHQAIDVTNNVTRFLHCVDEFIDAAKPFLV